MKAWHDYAYYTSQVLSISIWSQCGFLIIINKHLSNAFYWKRHTLCTWEFLNDQNYIMISNIDQFFSAEQIRMILKRYLKNNERYVRILNGSIYFVEHICQCLKATQPSTSMSHGQPQKVFSVRPSVSSAKTTQCPWWTMRRSANWTRGAWSRCTNSWLCTPP